MHFNTACVTRLFSPKSSTPLSLALNYLYQQIMDSFFKQVEQNKTSNNDQPICQSADLPLYLSTYLCSPSLSSRPYQSQMHCYQFAKYKHNIWSIKSSLACLLQFILIIALISPPCQPRSPICLISFRDNFSAQWTAKWSRNCMPHLI